MSRSLPSEPAGSAQGLSGMVRSYYEAGGYEVRRAAPDFLAFARGDEVVLAWVDEGTYPASEALSRAERQKRDEREAKLLHSFAHEMRAAPGAVGYYLIRRRVGLSQRFLSDAATLLRGGGVRVPMELFDTEYRSDASGGKAQRSVLGTLLAETRRVKRVAQPFQIRRGLAAENREPGGGDFVEFLETALMEPVTGPKLRFIDGGAGSGKTVAFNELARRLAEEFRAAKQERTVGRLRPIVFLPQHLREKQLADIAAAERAVAEGAKHWPRPSGFDAISEPVAKTALQGHVARVDDLISAVVETDLARAVTPGQFRWLLTGGFSIWMFDGLDEVYAGDAQFYRFLREVLTEPGSRAQIIVCSRDSLLSSSATTRAFLEERLAAGTDVEVYELAEWGPEAWTEIACLELEQGRAGAERSPRVRGFLAALESSAEIAALASLPFYCSVLLRHFKKHGALLQRHQDELDVMELVVDQMLEREHGKGLFDWTDLVEVDPETEQSEREAAEASLWRRWKLPMLLDPSHVKALTELLNEAGRENLLELIGGMAHLRRRSAVTAGEAEELTAELVQAVFEQSYAAANLEDRHVRHLMTAMVQFAFFGPGGAAGTIDFAHPVLGDYLAARYAASVLRKQAEAVREGRSASIAPALRQAVGTAEVEPGSIFHRYFLREVGKDNSLRALLETARRRGDAGRENVSRFLELVLKN